MREKTARLNHDMKGGTTDPCVRASALSRKICPVWLCREWLSHTRSGCVACSASVAILS